VNNKTTKEYLAPLPGEQYPTEKLPLEERWSAKSFNLKEIFDKLSLDEDNRLPVDWFVDCRDWNSYTEYLNNYNIKKPHDVLTKTHIHANIPYKA